MSKYQLNYTGAQVLAMLESIAGKAEGAALSAETTARQTADNTLQAYVNSGLAAKANLNSPALTGTPTAPTAAVGTNTTQIATMAAIQAAIAAQGSTAKIATGSYVGTGTYGSGNMCHIEIGFVPKIVILRGGGGIAIMTYINGNVSFTSVVDGSGSWQDCAYGAGANFAQWFSTADAYQQFNGSGTEYFWVAFA